MTGVAAALRVGTQPSADDELKARMKLLGLSAPADTVPASSLLDRLRAICPLRPLTWNEAERIAERQADALRRHLGGERPALPTSALLELPFLTVTYRDGFPTSGLVTKTDLGWVVVIKGDEPTVRQRFSLAHEIKHVIDDAHMVRLAGDLYPATALYSAKARRERVAERFAAALLMPKLQLRRDWTEGLQDVDLLARRYDVSRVAMEIRLLELRLVEPTPRCAVPKAGEDYAGARA